MPSFPSIFGLDLLGGRGGTLGADLAGLGIIPPAWGIFSRGGQPVVLADNVIRADYRKEYTVSNYPVEEGSFESYDKVELPFDMRLTFTAGGSLANRQALLDSLEAIQGDLQLYDVVTPEKTYTSVNVTHIDYNRREGSSGMLVVEVWVTQIRVGVTDELSATREPSGASTVDGGDVQAQDLSPSKQAALQKAFDSGQTAYYVEE